MEALFPHVGMENIFAVVQRQKIHSHKVSKLSKKLFHSSPRIMRGGCIFTAIAGSIGAISAAASSAAGTVAATAVAVGSAVASSTIATSAVTGIVTRAATVAGAAIADKVIN